MTLRATWNSFVLSLLVLIIITAVQIAAIEVPEEYMGSVVELLGKRRGQMLDMEASGFVPHSSLSIRSGVLLQL